MPRVIAAMYENRSTAEEAMSDLENTDGPQRTIYLLDSDDGQSLDRIRIPGRAQQMYQHGLREGAVLVAVQAQDGDTDVERVLDRHDPIDVDGRFGSEEAAQARTTNRPQRPANRRPADERRGTRGADEEATIPIVEEQANVGKREVAGGGVRVRSHVIETPVEEDVELRDEHVDVDRRKADRPVSDADRAFEERTIEARETREEPVVNKQARVIEEVVIHKHSDTRTEHVSDTVRKTDVDVDRLEAGFRKDAEQRFGGEYSYDQVAPAYRYGHQLGRTEDRDWNQVEADARTRFEERNPGQWDRFRGAVEHGYRRTREGR